MSVQLPPVDRRSDFHRIQDRVLTPAAVPVRADRWEGDRHRTRWTWFDELVYGEDTLPLAMAAVLFLFFLCAGRH